MPPVAARHVRVHDVHLPEILRRHRDVVVDVARHLLKDKWIDFYLYFFFDNKHDIIRMLT